MENVTVRVKLKALRKGDYTVYVFHNLDQDSYIMITKLPNWGEYHLKIGDEGFLTYKEVIAGETSWFDHRNTRQQILYRYTGNYFVDFVSLENEISYDKDKNLVIEGI